MISNYKFLELPQQKRFEYCIKDVTDFFHQDNEEREVIELDEEELSNLLFQINRIYQINFTRHDTAMLNEACRCMSLMSDFLLKYQYCISRIISISDAILNMQCNENHFEFHVNILDGLYDFLEEGLTPDYVICALRLISSVIISSRENTVFVLDFLNENRIEDLIRIASNPSTALKNNIDFSGKDEGIDFNAYESQEARYLAVNILYNYFIVCERCSNSNICHDKVFHAHLLFFEEIQNAIQNELHHPDSLKCVLALTTIYISVFKHEIKCCENDDFFKFFVFDLIKIVVNVKSKNVEFAFISLAKIIQMTKRVESIQQIFFRQIFQNYLNSEEYRLEYNYHIMVLIDSVVLSQNERVINLMFSEISFPLFRFFSTHNDPLYKCTFCKLCQNIINLNITNIDLFSFLESICMFQTLFGLTENNEFSVKKEAVSALVSALLKFQANSLLINLLDNGFIEKITPFILSDDNDCVFIVRVIDMILDFIHTQSESQGLVYFRILMNENSFGEISGLIKNYEGFQNKENYINLFQTVITKATDLRTLFSQLL